MVWLDGDNDLNPEAIVDFHEMEYGLHLARTYDPDILDKLQVIVQYDSNAEYNTASSEHGRYQVQPSGTAADGSTDLTNMIQSIDEPNMGSAAELADFIDFCKTAYPAEHYALILWNHGGGVRSIRKDSTGDISREICEDQTDDDYLYVGEIKDYLDSSHSVDFLGMDACLMGFLEVAYEFRPGTGDFGADVLAFSPAAEQGDGWEYERIFNRFSGSGLNESSAWGSDPCYDIDTVTAADFAGIAVKEYGDAFSSSGLEDQTLTAVDLHEIAGVKAAADGFAATLTGYQSQIETVRGAVGEGNLLAYFTESNLGEWISYAGFDLYELAEQVKVLNLDAAVNSAADALMAAVDTAVIASWAQSGYDSSYDTGFEAGKNGLAIFFPDGDAMYQYQEESHPYWQYQHWYNGVSNSAYDDWWNDPNYLPQYGALDFCTSDGDGIVEGWFELLQYWFNPADTTPNNYNPSPLE